MDYDDIFKNPFQDSPQQSSSSSKPGDPPLDPPSTEFESLSLSRKSTSETELTFKTAKGLFSSDVFNPFEGQAAYNYDSGNEQKYSTNYDTATAQSTYKDDTGNEQKTLGFSYETGNAQSTFNQTNMNQQYGYYAQPTYAYTSYKQPEPIQERYTDQSIFSPQRVETFNDPLSAVDTEPTIDHLPQPKQETVKEEPQVLTFSIILPGVKVGLGPSGYIEYPIKTSTSNPNFRNSAFTTLRRYSDFLWLFNQLFNKYPGVIIPPISEKNTLSKFQKDFIDKRIVYLSLFLNQVNSHPVLGDDQDVIDFLESETFQNDKPSKTARMLIGEVVPLVDQAFPGVDDKNVYFVEKRDEMVVLDQWLRDLAKLASKAKDLLTSQTKENTNFCKGLEDLATYHSKSGESKLTTKLYQFVKMETQINQTVEQTDLFKPLQDYIEFTLMTLGSLKLEYVLRNKYFKNMNSLKQVLDKVEKEGLESQRVLVSKEQQGLLEAKSKEAREAFEGSEKEWDEFNGKLKSEIEAFSKNVKEGKVKAFGEFKEVLARVESFKLQLYRQFK